MLQIAQNTTLNTLGYRKLTLNIILALYIKLYHHYIHSYSSNHTPQWQWSLLNTQGHNNIVKTA